MYDDASLLGEVYEPFPDLSPVTIGFEDCEGFLAHLQRRKAAAEKNSARHSSGTQQLLGTAELDNA